MEETYRLLFENNPQPMWVYHIETLEFLAVNNAAVSHYGYSREEFLTMTIKDIRPPEDIPVLLDNVSKTLPQGLDSSPNWRHCKKDGTIIDVEITSHALMFDQKPARLVLVTDVTSHKQAKMALQESEERFRRAFENAPIGMALVGLDDRLLQVNQALCDILGYSREELLTKTVAAITHPDDIALEATQKQEMNNKSASNFSMDKRYIHADGHVVWAQLNVSGVTDSQGRMLYFIGQLQDITARKESEKKLRFQAQLLDSVRESVAATNLEGEVIYWGKGAQELYGYSAKEVLGQLITFIVPTEDAHEEEARIRQVLEQGSWSGTYLQRRKDGSKFWADTVISLVKDEQGHPTGLIGIDRDITERKQAEIEREMLLATEREQRLVAETLQEVTLALTSHIDHTEVFDEILRQVQRLVPCRTTNIALLKDKALHVVRWQGYKAFENEAFISNLVQPLANVPLEAQIVHNRQPLVIPNTEQEPDWVMFEETAWIKSFIAIPICQHSRVFGVLRLESDSAGEFSMMHAQRLLPLANAAAIALENARLYEQIKQELADRKQAEEKLQFQNALLEAQSEATLDGILVVSEKQKWLFYNQRFVQIWGIPEELIQQNSSTAALRWIEDCCVDPTFSEELLADANSTWRDQIRHKDGRIFDRYSAPVQGNDETSYGRVWYYRDITEQRKLEEQLLQAQKMDAVGKMAGGVAHNFNNMLTAIIGYAALAHDLLPKAHPAEQDIVNIQRTAQRAAELTRQLLTFTRSHFSQSVIIDLNDLIIKTKPMLRQLVTEAVDLVVLTEPDLATIKADPNQLEQLLANLVSNARDAMPYGGKLTIKTANVSFDKPHINPYATINPGQYVALIVSDTGQGMSEDILEHVFEPFFTTKEVGQGTGLGLSICFGIVRQSNGHIVIDSDPGQGTTFWVYLPAVDEARTSTSIPSSSPVQLPPGTETILVVEDETSVRELTASLLRRQGYTVLEAINGEDALRLIHEQPEQKIHLVISDVVMPRMGGNVLANKLRSQYSGLKVILMSGYTDETAVGQSKLDGAIPFLAKPFTREVLLNKVRQILDADPKN